jgi:hypothetical protein
VATESASDRLPQVSGVVGCAEISASTDCGCFEFYDDCSGVMVRVSVFSQRVIKVQRNIHPEVKVRSHERSLIHFTVQPT